MRDSFAVGRRFTHELSWPVSTIATAVAGADSGVAAGTIATGWAVARSISYTGASARELTVDNRGLDSHLLSEWHDVAFSKIRRDHAH
jgi:hypothetical protein